MFGLMVSYLSFDYIGYGHESGFWYLFEDIIQLQKVA